MVIGFIDQGDVSLTDEFQRWRRSNPNGFFLTFGSRVVLHATNCWHPGKPDWDCIEFRDGREFKVSLTKHRKVCCINQAELLTWADREGIIRDGCLHCIREPLTKIRFKRIEYHENLPGREFSARQGLPQGLIETGKIWEGIAKEITTTRHSRSSKLRLAALEQANGICECCRTDFSKLLNGLGVRVLQAHHRSQLALAGNPRLNGIEDLAVLCANCHALIHIDMKSSLAVEELHQMLSMTEKVKRCKDRKLDL